jgi:biopolymer transport protein TolR
MGASIKGSSGSGGRRGRRARRQPMGEINVTPFVDVMLVLLIIFMVTAPLMATAVPLDLPTAGAQPVDSPKQEPLQVSFDKSGRIFIGSGEQPVTIDELETKLRAIAQSRDTSEPVVVRGEKVAEYRQFVQISRILNSLGFKKLGLATDESGTR